MPVPAVSESKKATYAKRLRASCVIDPDTGCWNWTKKKSSNGYGDFAFGGGKNGRAHRVAYEVFIGPIDPGLYVCHRCDNRACVNVEHLFLGTCSDNLQDALAKGRMNLTSRSRGSTHHNAVLTEDNVVQIKRRLLAGEARSEIARAYGVTPTNTNIRAIDLGLTWKHVKVAA